MNRPTQELLRSSYCGILLMLLPSIFHSSSKVILKTGPRVFAHSFVRTTSKASNLLLVLYVIFKALCWSFCFTRISSVFAPAIAGLSVQAPFVLTSCFENTCQNRALPG